MKTITLSILLIMFSTISIAQKQIIIHGRIDLPVKSKHIRITGYGDVPIQPDGTFEMKSEAKSPDISLIMTDSSSASAIWMQPGEYFIHCREILSPSSNKPLFRTPVLKGPADAELYNSFQNQLYDGFGMQIQPGEDQNSLRERRKNHVTEYMDSILNTNHASLVIGNIVRSTQFYVGDSITAVFIQKLTPELRNSSEIALLEKGFKRKEKISREKAFENFSMKDANGKTFTLSSLAGKKAILVDMWASSCGPCRAEHPLLKKWYQKYADKGLEIVSVSIDDDKGQWLKAMKDDGIQQWINVCDTSSWESDLVKHYYIPYIPFRFLLDGNRNIILVDNKQDSWIREKDIANLLQKQ